MEIINKIKMTEKNAITAKLAEFIVETQYEDVPDEVIRLAKNSMLDTLGVALGGMPERATQLLIRYVRELGGTPAASVLAGGFKTNAPNAALINGTAADIVGWSDVSVVQMNHPSVSVCPAVWAVGEQLRASGKEILLAQVIGTEIANKISAGIRPGFQIKGWHPLAVLNTFGVAAAAGKLLGLDAMEMRNALGIAGAETSGIRAALGTMSKAYGAGRSARDGIVCAQLASIGYTGPINVLEMRDGFLQTFGNGSSGEEILENLGNPFEFSFPGIMFKKFPACTRSHTGIQGVLDLREKYGFSAHDVESIDCFVTPAVIDVLTFPTPKSKFEAKYSMEFCLATALRDGKVITSSFSDEKVNDPDLISLMRRVKMTVWQEYADGYNPPDAPYGCLINIKLKNGHEFSTRVDKAPWGAESPPSWQDLVKKYQDNSGFALTKNNLSMSIDIVRNFEEIEDVSSLMNIVRGVN